jgi:hypothetical protein
MAQRIVTLCDAHQQHDEDAPGVTWEVSLTAPGDSKPTVWEVDLCEDDGKTLRDLAVMLGTIGRRTAGPRTTAATAPRSSSGTPPNPTTAHRAPGGLPCPVEGCEETSPTYAASASHVRRVHDMTMAQARGIPEPYACPDCDFRSSRPQGLGAHRKAAHGTAGAGASSGG